MVKQAFKVRSFLTITASMMSDFATGINSVTNLRLKFLCLISKEMNGEQQIITTIQMELRGEWTRPMMV